MSALSSVTTRLSGERCCIADTDGCENIVEEVDGRPNCTCNFMSRMQLPCRHIFLSQTARGAELFSERWVPRRWRQDQQVIRADRPPSSTQPVAVTLSITKRPPLSILGKREKYQEMMRVMKVMADMCSDMGQAQFKECYQLLQNLLEFWSTGRQVTLLVSFSS